MSLKDFTHKILPIKDKLFRFSLRIVRNSAIAEDVVQEVFIKLWNKRDQLDQLHNVEAWCMKATRNLSIDKLRSKHSKVGFIPDGYDVSSTAATPDRITESNDTISRVKTMMENLPEKQKLVMQLRDIEEMTYQEISDTLDMPMSQVKVYLFRARQQIRRQLINSESYGL